MRANLSTQRRARSLHDEPIRRFLRPGTDRLEVSDDGGDAVALLHPKLLRPPNRRDALRARGETPEQHELVDHPRHIRSLDRRSAKGGRARANRAHRLARRLTLSL